MATTTTPASVISIDDLTEFSIAAMVRNGLHNEDARTAAQVLVTTDTWGVHTHGTKQLKPLMMNVRDGRINTSAAPELVAEGPGWAMFDSHFAMPMVTSTLAMRTAMRKAAETGIGYAGVRHSTHFGAAGYYASLALEQDMLGLSMCNVDKCMTVPGARGQVMGTNPLAFAIPAGREWPVFLDIATSAVAASKVFAARALGKSIPDTWLVDDDGNPTTDPTIFPESGALLPMSGHKGYGLAILIEVLSAVLTGSAITGEVKSWIKDIPDPADQGHAFIALNVGAMMPIDAFKARMDWLIGYLHDTPKAEGNDRIYLPGEMEWERRQRALQQGIALPDDVVANLRVVAQDVGLDIDGLFKPCFPDTGR
ncbi:MAG: Ldh family oxidoreductase [Anaerolineae bacterium]